MTQCAIYTRVSSERQVREGNGASSQEQRCRAYAASRGYGVARVFSDQGVSGALAERPALRGLLDFVGSAEPGTVVLIDDISRIARDVRVHIELRAAIRAAGGRLESPSLAFEDDPASEFVEIIMAANAQFGRRGNRKQVIDRQRARLEQGFWPFHAPVGYRNAPHQAFKRTIVPVPEARALAEGLEGYAAGRIASKADLARLLVGRGFFPRALAQGAAEKRVTRIFDSLALYAGFVEYPPWRVARVEGRHEGVISRETFHRLLAREAGPAGGRSLGATDAFPLRNFVRCAGCGRPLTGALIKGRYPSYTCYDPACGLHGKRIKGRVLVAGFRALLDRLEAPPAAFELVERLARAARSDGMRPDFAGAWARLSTVVRSPGDYWATGSLEQKRTVHRLVFAAPPAYDRETGFSTVSLTVPYRVSPTFPGTESCLVEAAGVAPASVVASAGFLHAQAA